MENVLLENYGIKHFKVNELVPKEIYAMYGDGAVQFLDIKAVRVIEFLRKDLGKPVYVNNWDSGGLRQESGYRVPNTKTGGKLSQHKFGRAFDVRVEGMTPQEVYDYILANESKYLAAGLTCMENIKFTPTWNHLDTRAVLDLSKIRIVNP